MTVSPKQKLAVVLFNLGGPDGPAAVRPFLRNLFSDPAIIGAPGFIRLPLAAFISTTRTPSAQKNYDMMGGGSPLLPETEAQAEALRRRLQILLPEHDIRVFIAMRYWKPFTETTARDVAAFAPDEVVLLPLYPQFSTTTTGSSLKAWTKAYRGSGKVHAVCCYPEAPGFVQAHADRIEAAWRDAGSPCGVRLLFSAHGLPEKVIKDGDPYQAQIEQTAAAVASRLPGEWDWQVCYQSRVGPLKWIGPSTIEAITAAQAESKGILITPIAFVSEHVETLVELDHEYGELAKALGVETYIRVPALGVAASFVDTLARSVEDALPRTGVHPYASAMCGGCHGKCPRTCA